MQDEAVKSLVERIRTNDSGFNTEGRILRLKHHLRHTAGPLIIGAVIEALRHNTRIEALYLQNFERVWLFLSSSGDARFGLLVK